MKQKERFDEKPKQEHVKKIEVDRGKITYTEFLL